MDSSPVRVVAAHDETAGAARCFPPDPPSGKLQSVSALWSEASIAASAGGAARNILSPIMSDDSASAGKQQLQRRPASFFGAPDNALSEAEPPAPGQRQADGYLPPASTGSGGGSTRSAAGTPDGGSGSSGRHLSSRRKNIFKTVMCRDFEATARGPSHTHAQTVVLFPVVRRLAPIPSHAASRCASAGHVPPLVRVRLRPRPRRHVLLPGRPRSRRAVAKGGLLSPSSFASYCPGRHAACTRLLRPLRRPRGRRRRRSGAAEAKEGARAHAEEAAHREGEVDFPCQAVLV